jgi:glycosidase
MMISESIVGVGTKITMVVVYAILVLFLWAFVRHRIAIKPTGLVHPDWSRNASIYEVNLRQYTPEGTFKAFQQHLPRLKKMGVEILWLMPINPIGEKHRKGSLGSYYSVRDFLKINPELGTMDDFRNLVSEAHSLGMKVIIDWIANHTSWDNELITTHPEWYMHDGDGKIVSPVKEWTDAAGLDYNQPGLREYMIGALSYWIKEADIDGYRCDVAGMVPVSFWNEAVPKIRKMKKIFMLAEWETPEMHDTAFDATYSFELYHLMNAIAKGEKPASEIDSLLEKEAETYPVDAYRLRYTSNHDENSWNGSEYERMGDAAKTFAALTFCVPGIPLIYSGQESAFTHRLKFFDKDQISWDDYKLAGFYTTLVNLKRHNTALWNGAAGGLMTKVVTDDDKEIYAFTRIRGTGKLLAIFNLSHKQKEVRFLSRNYIGEYVNIFSNEQVSLKEDAQITLKPWEYMILEKR